MTKRWAVGYVNWFDHDDDLIIEITNADDWQGALRAHSYCADLVITNDLETTKQRALDVDCMIEVIEITDQAADQADPKDE